MSGYGQNPAGFVGYPFETGQWQNSVQPSPEYGSFPNGPNDIFLQDPILAGLYPQLDRLGTNGASGIHHGLPDTPNSVPSPTHNAFSRINTNVNNMLPELLNRTNHYGSTSGTQNTLGRGFNPTDTVLQFPPLLHMQSSQPAAQRPPCSQSRQLSPLDNGRHRSTPSHRDRLRSPSQSADEHTPRVNRDVIPVVPSVTLNLSPRTSHTFALVPIGTQRTVARSTSLSRPTGPVTDLVEDVSAAASRDSPGPRSPREPSGSSPTNELAILRRDLERTSNRETDRDQDRDRPRSRNRSRSPNRLRIRDRGAIPDPTRVGGTLRCPHAHCDKFRQRANNGYMTMERYKRHYREAHR